MIIVYASNTGYTKQYAEIVSKNAKIDAFPVDEIPAGRTNEVTIFMGWVMAGKVVGYKKAKEAGCKILCVVAVGMSPESPAQTNMIKKSLKGEPYMDVYYVQGGYDYKKLKGINKLLMKVKSKEIIARYDGMSEAEKKENATYRMVTEGYSVVNEDRVAAVVAWALMHYDNK